MDTPRKRLEAVLPHLKIATEMARLEVPGGTVKLGVIAETPGGVGRLTARFESAQFLEDLELTLKEKKDCNCTVCVEERAESSKVI